MIINMTGSGGGGLNVKVVAYSVTPTGTAAENTIGVVTDTAITSWVMQAEQPTGTAGLVWIEVAAASDVAFYVDKKNMIKVYPVVAYQYIGGTWVIKDSYIYQNAAWVILFNGYLYYYGNEFESLTGGWIARAGSVVGANIIKDTDGITLKSNGSVNMQTANKIDLSGFNTISVSVTDSTASFCFIGATQSGNDYFNAGQISANWPTTTPNVQITSPAASFTATLDVSGCSGLWTVVIAIRSDGTGTKTMTVRRVQLTIS